MFGCALETPNNSDSHKAEIDSSHSNLEGGSPELVGSPAQLACAGSGLLLPCFSTFPRCWLHLHDPKWFLTMSMFQGAGWRQGRESIPFSFRITPKCCTHHFYSHPIVNLVTRPHLTAREAGKDSHYSGLPYIQLKILFCGRRRE